MVYPKRQSATKKKEKKLITIKAAKKKYDQFYAVHWFSAKNSMVYPNERYVLGLSVKLNQIIAMGLKFLEESAVQRIRVGLTILNTNICAKTNENTRKCRQLSSHFSVAIH